MKSYYIEKYDIILYHTFLKWEDEKAQTGKLGLCTVACMSRASINKRATNRTGKTSFRLRPHRKELCTCHYSADPREL